MTDQATEASRGAGLPLRGMDAYRRLGSRPASLSRAAQLGYLAVFASGSESQRESARADAADLGVPRLINEGRVDGVGEETLSQLARSLAQDHAADGGWIAGVQPMAPTGIGLLRAELDSAPLAEGVAGFAWINLDNEVDVERAMAGAAVVGLAASSALLRAGAPVELLAPRAHSVLQGCLKSRDRLAAEIAAVALGAATPSLEGPVAAVQEGASQDPISIAVHGTWSRLVEDRWYAPEGKLNRHIREESRVKELYAEEDYFRWSGAYHLAEREAASAELIAWQRARTRPIRVAFAHSHGGNVVMGAASEGLQVQLLVLMHTPVLARSEEAWSQVRQNVGRTLVMRTRADLVVLADGLRNGSTARPNQALLPFRELVAHWANRSAWFSHSFFTQTSVWHRYRVAREVDYELGGLPAPKLTPSLEGEGGVLTW